MKIANVVPLVALQHFAVDNDILPWEDTILHLRVLSPGKNKAIIDWDRKDFEIEDFRFSLECRMIVLGFMDKHKYPSITVIENDPEI